MSYSFFPVLNMLTHRIYVYNIGRYNNNPWLHIGVIWDQQQNNNNIIKKKCYIYTQNYIAKDNPPTHDSDIIFYSTYKTEIYITWEYWHITQKGSKSIKCSFPIKNHVTVNWFFCFTLKKFVRKLKYICFFYILYSIRDYYTLYKYYIIIKSILFYKSLLYKPISREKKKKKLKLYSKSANSYIIYYIF
jgi:hypothetical protein